MSAAAFNSNEYREIALELIDVPAGRRALNPDWVEALGVDMVERGQRTPIEVVARGERFQLVIGGHRVAGLRQQGRHAIKALVKQPADFAHEAEIKLAEIVENFMRRELSVLDRAFDVAKWREIFEEVRGTVKRGGDRRSTNQNRKVATLIDGAGQDGISEQFAASFTEAAQRALGLSKDAVFRALKIAKLGDDVRQRISLMPIANNQSELLSLVAQGEERWPAVVEQLILGVASVAEAVAIIDDLKPEAPRAPWERISESFSRLKADQQGRFFALHEDAIRAWLAGR